MENSQNLFSCQFEHFDYSFENYLRGPSNLEAFDVFVQAANSWKNHQPIWLYGPTSVGKTHLAVSLLKDVATRDEGLRLHLTNSERFLIKQKSADRNDTMHLFEITFSQLDILVFEDFHLIKKEADSTQRILAGIISRLFQRGSLVIFSSDAERPNIEGYDSSITDLFGAEPTIVGIGNMSLQERETFIHVDYRNRFKRQAPPHLVEEIMKIGGSPRAMQGLLNRFNAMLTLG